MRKDKMLKRKPNLYCGDGGVVFNRYARYWNDNFYLFRSSKNGHSRFKKQSKSDIAAALRKIQQSRLSRFVRGARIERKAYRVLQALFL